MVQRAAFGTAPTRADGYRRAMSATDGPLLVFGPRSLDYDFGPHHPLTPLRFGPGIDLLRHVGAEPSIEPVPASDEQLLWVHTRRYVDAVRRHDDSPWLPPELGIGLSDNPAFPGMHDAGAAVAGGSIRAMEAILRGDTLHAHHPGGGLHHAMPERCWGFCIYDDPALAIARARQDDLRVLYVDVDVHHGDGVQTVFFDDPGVLTISLHESGRYLFPETGFPDELGVGAAAGTSVNMPFEPYSGETVWLEAFRSIVLPLAAAFGPDVVVSQHGADAHAFDPLAHLRVTTTAQAEVARLVDGLAHRYAGGRWLATGGGGYAAYRTVPRVWALTWLAGAHREPPESTPEAWRERWAAAAETFGDAPLPRTFTDPPNAGIVHSPEQEAAERKSAAVAAVVRRVVVPRLLREAEDRGWASFIPEWPPRGVRPATAPEHVPRYRPAILEHIDANRLERLTLAPRVIPPLDPEDGKALLLAAVQQTGTHLTAAVDETTIVGAILTAPSAAEPLDRSLLTLGVAPAVRRQGLATRLLEVHFAGERPGDNETEALITVAERDPVDPLDAGLRTEVARKLLDRAGFRIDRLPPELNAVDRWALAGRR
jgi:acetoin utilization protein AcuC